MINILERLHSRLAHALGRGLVTVVDDTKPVQVVQIQLNSMVTRDAVPHLQHFGFSSVPPVGSEAIVNAMGGDPLSSVVVATLHKASRPKNMKPGQSQLYDQSGSSVLLTNDHNAVIAATGTIAVTGGTISMHGTNSIELVGTVDITGPLNITGDVHITGALVLNPSYSRYGRDSLAGVA